MATDNFPCPGCGGQMQFSPEAQMLTCQFCGTETPIDTQGTIVEHAIDEIAAYESRSWGRETRVIHCENCGGETVIGASEKAAFCAFCGSSHVVQSQEEPGASPESLIAFKISRKMAQEAFRKWIGHRWFAPNALKKSYVADKLAGLYLPFWTFDASTDSSYTCEVGHDYYTTETYVEYVDGKPEHRTRQVCHTRWSFASGDHQQGFDDVLINASDKFNPTRIRALEPFFTKELSPYKPEYLAGFLCEKYAKGGQQSLAEAKDRMLQEVSEAITAKQHADHVRGLNVNIRYRNLTFKHILLPIWLSSYTYGTKIYQFCINGQTGEVQGDAPVSPWKVAGAVGAGLLLGYLYYLYFYR